VYGNGSWLRQFVVDPILSGRRVRQFGRGRRLVSPLHVQDCVRALVHLAEVEHPHGRYFLANSEPVRTGDFAATFARIADRPLRVLRLPLAAARLIVAPPFVGCLQSDAVLSNIRLRGTGFRFDHPTLEHGLRQVLGAVYE